ncbi:hypothetical protein C0J52_12671, partial [Blattella germanica]
VSRRARVVVGPRGVELESRVRLHSSTVFVFLVKHCCLGFLVPFLDVVLFDNSKRNPTQFFGLSKSADT